MDRFNELFEWDENGKKRRRPRVLPDGASFHFPYIADAAYGFRSTFADGSVDHTHPCRPGFRFADTDDSARAAADEAYEQMRTRLSDAWRNKDAQAEDNRNPAPPPTRTLDALRALAEKAWEERNERMRNAWRQR